MKREEIMEAIEIIQDKNSCFQGHAEYDLMVREDVADFIEKTFVDKWDLLKDSGLDKPLDHKVEL